METVTFYLHKSWVCINKDEFDVLQRMLNFHGERVLELGCGGAQKTRQIAGNTGVASIIAAEVDQIQHEKNLQIDDMPAVAFKSYGAEKIEEPDAGFDIVLMFKSLHHVPVELMDQALREIVRVLKPGGYAYIETPEGYIFEIPNRVDLLQKPH